jgi:sigma-E factor negative regulatory protein RseA
MSNIKTNDESQRVSQSDEAWSALVDGEAVDHEIDAMLAAFAADGEARARWHRYQVIGDVLRGSAPAVTGAPAADFLASLRTRLDSERPEWRPAPAPAARPQPSVVAVQADLVARPSANEAVFRWKLVAGFASLAAVMAVSWGVMGSLAPSDAGPQLARSDSAAPVPAAEQVATPASQPLVVVPTGQGPVIRDPQLEALMAEHRQHAGMSALQMPAGFLRNATFDAPSR